MLNPPVMPTSLTEEQRRFGENHKESILMDFPVEKIQDQYIPPVGAIIFQDQMYDCSTSNRIGFVQEVAGGWMAFWSCTHPEECYLGTYPVKHQAWIAIDVAYFG